MNSFAPIALFVYNRPLHTQMLLDSLIKNPLYTQSELFIFSDGPKSNSDQKTSQSISEVRKLVRSQKWGTSVNIVEREHNFGLAGSIVQGIGEVLKNYDSVIVLEDDLILSPFFLNFMNKNLEIYREEERVMHVSGYVYPIKGQLPHNFFLGITTCWGWATWKRAWNHYNPDAQMLMNKILLSGRMNEFTFNGAAPFCHHLLSNISGDLNTWAIKWQASVFLKNGLTLHPYPSLVKNIGNDGSGEHGDQTDIYSMQKTADVIEITKLEVKENIDARALTEKFYKQLYTRKNFLHRILGKAKRTFMPSK